MGSSSGLTTIVVVTLFPTGEHNANPLTIWMPLYLKGAILGQEAGADGAQRDPTIESPPMTSQYLLIQRFALSATLCFSLSNYGSSIRRTLV